MTFQKKAFSVSPLQQNFLFHFRSSAKIRGLQAVVLSHNMSSSPTRITHKIPVHSNETRLSFTPGFESKFDELKSEVVRKIEKELGDSHNAREYISRKYDELCNKITYLTELDSTVTGFRSDVQSIEKQICDLTMRVDQIEKRAIGKECGSITSSNVVNMNLN